MFAHSEDFHLYAFAESQPLSLNHIASSFFLFFPLEFLLRMTLDHISWASLSICIFFVIHIFSHLVNSLFRDLSSFFKYAFCFTFFFSLPFLKIIKPLSPLPIPLSCLFLIYCILFFPLVSAAFSFLISLVTLIKK